MQLTLFIPELLWPEPEDRDTLDKLDCPALTILLARGRLSRRPPRPMEATLAERFGHAEGAPYGAFRLLGEAGMTADAGEKRWVGADPVHLRYHQESLILADGGHLDIAAAEAQALADDLNRYFSGLGRFHMTTAGRGYLQLDDETTLEGFAPPPLSAVAGRRIEHLFTDLTRDRSVRKLLNEIQTFLHAHPANRQRENEGRMTINSLWLWGPGSLPPRIESDFDGVWSTNPLAIGLARAAGVPTHPVPADADAFLAHAAPGTQQLAVLEDLLGPVQYENGDAYRQAIVSLEERWFAPLREALTSGKLRQLRIEATTAYATLIWETCRADRWKFWRRPQPLAELVTEFATE